MFFHHVIEESYIVVARLSTYGAYRHDDMQILVDINIAAVAVNANVVSVHVPLIHSAQYLNAQAARLLMDASMVSQSRMCEHGNPLAWNLQGGT